MDRPVSWRLGWRGKSGRTRFLFYRHLATPAPSTGSQVCFFAICACAVSRGSRERDRWEQPFLHLSLGAATTASSPLIAVRSCGSDAFAVSSSREKVVFYDPSGNLRPVPFPDHLRLLGGPALRRHREHGYSFPLVILAAASGAILGDNLGFWVGREGGFRLLRRYGRYIRLDERKLKLGLYLFRRHGG